MIDLYPKCMFMHRIQSPSGILCIRREISIFEIRARRIKDSFDVQLNEIYRVHLILTRISLRLKEMVHSMHKIAIMRWQLLRNRRFH